MDGGHEGFTSFSTVFQSYQDDGRVIMKSSVQKSDVSVGYCCLPPAGLEPVIILSEKPKFSILNLFLPVDLSVLII